MKQDEIDALVAEGIRQDQQTIAELAASLQGMLDLYAAFDGPVGPTVIMARAAIEKATGGASHG